MQYPETEGRTCKKHGRPHDMHFVFEYSAHPIGPDKPLLGPLFSLFQIQLQRFYKRQLVKTCSKLRFCSSLKTMRRENSVSFFQIVNKNSFQRMPWTPQGMIQLPLRSRQKTQIASANSSWMFYKRYLEFRKKQFSLVFLTQRCEQISVLLSEPPAISGYHQELQDVLNISGRIENSL